MTTPAEFAQYFGESQKSRLGVLEMLMSTVPVGVWYTNEGGAVIYVNDTWSKVTGVSAEAVLDRGYRNVLHPDDVRYIDKAMELAIATKSDYEVTFRLRSGDRGYRWYYSKAVWSDKHNGFPAGLVGITLDVTEKHQLGAEGTMLWHCMSQVTNPLIITNPISVDNPIIYVNPAFCALTGYASEDALGRNPRFLHNGDGDQPVLKVIRDAIAAGKALANIVVRNYTKSGQLYFAELHLSPVYVGGVLTYWVGIQSVVTEKVRAREIDELRTVVNQLLSTTRPPAIKG